MYGKDNPNVSITNLEDDKQVDTEDCRSNNDATEDDDEDNV